MHGANALKRHRVEVILGLVFVAILLAYGQFVSGGPKLSKEEVAGYVAKIDNGLKMPEPMRSEFLARVKTWGEADDGKPVYTANIFHANDAAEMQKAIWPGLDIKPAADGDKTHEIYLEAVKPLILPKGVWPAIGTKAQGVGGGKTNVAGFYPGYDEWSEININRYPGRRAVLELFSHPTYLEVMPYKLVGLRLLTVPTDLRFQLPAAIIVNELAQETGPVARGPYDVAPEPNLTNTPSGPGPVALRFEGLDLRIENVATPGLTIADREAARTGGLPPGVSMPIPYTSWSVESTAVFGAADVSLRTILPAGDMRATRLVVLKAEGDAPFQILPTTRRIENRPSIVLVTATTRVTGFSHFALGVLESAPPILNGVVSRKTHGAVGSFDLALGFVPSNPTTEPRTGGAGGSHTLVFTFDKAVTGGTAALTEGTASAGAVSYVGAEMIVPLAGAANAQYLTVTLTNVTSADGGAGGGGAVRIGFLAGDVNGSRNVTLTDVLMVNAALTQPVAAANFLRDVNLSGTLTISDALFVNANLTQFLPGP